MSDVNNAPERSGADPFWDQNRTRRDEVGSAATSGGLAGISGVDWLFYAAVAAISLGIGVVNAFSAAQDAAWRGAVYDVRTPLFWEMSSIVTIIAVAPVLFVAVRRMRHVSRRSASALRRPRSLSSRACTSPAWSAFARR